MSNELLFWNRKADKNVFFNSANRDKFYEEVDLSSVGIYSSHVDTFKQLFEGFISSTPLSLIQLHYDNTPNLPIQFGDLFFKVSRSSSKAGFQWVLKNLDIGVVILLKSFYADVDTSGTHLKIEYSPHFLNSHSFSDVDGFSVEIANLFMTEYKFASVAVHLACDFGGFDIPDNLEKNLKTKAKRCFDFSGVDDYGFDISTNLVRYGSNESYTVGSPSSIQMCLYNKSVEADKRDKLGYWIGHWLNQDLDYVDHIFSGAVPVVNRLEARFHHSVIKQFSKGTKGMDATNMSTLAPHLNGLWKYFLKNFRLQHSNRYIHPLWQLFMEDCNFEDTNKPLMYKRDYSKDSSGSSNRNVAFWIGNALRLFARQQFTTDFIVKYFMDSNLYSELKHYLKLPGISTTEDIEPVLRDFVDKRMNDHLLNGVAV